ncbi:MAG TPA: hydroxyethylthiazole kinase [Xanthobacteraceae bacterium]|nr:hydroxyethylthiazole kinase [Xanthobacteraceae bacterium]
MRRESAPEHDGHLTAGPIEGAAGVEIVTISADILDRIRTRRPRVHCITNTVAQSFTANVILAAGAVPSMTIAPDEIAAFVHRAEALLVNLGTLDNERRKAIDIAIKAANDRGLPWVLDPVLVDRSEPRASYAHSLISNSPRAIRLNAQEFTALSGAGPDPDSLRGYALKTQAAIGLTGEVDLIANDARIIALKNGDPLMAYVTAMGCVASALIAACLAVERDPWLATASALLIWGVAGERAAKAAKGPGSFQVNILDTLYQLDCSHLIETARVH